MAITHSTSDNKIICIPGLVREAYYEASSRKVATTPTLIKSALTKIDGGKRTGDGIGDDDSNVDATTAHFEWTTTGSLGDFYVIRAIGALKWARDYRNQFVAQGLEVECTCAHGEKQAIISKSLGKIVVCKHASAALASVLDPYAVCPENVSTTLGPTTTTTTPPSYNNNNEPAILYTGVSISEHISKSRRGKACESCGFQNWNVGDVKYIVEHWENPESDHGGREHLCLGCAVGRGLVADHEGTKEDGNGNGNHNDNDNDDKCQGCGNFPVDQIGRCIVEGLLKVQENNTKNVILLCFTCAYDRFHTSLQPSAGKKRKL
eukprot:jgi/Psemu1/30423/gm1.30423_g